MPHGQFRCFIGLCIHALHLIDTFVNPRVNWQINSLLIGNQTFHKYEVAATVL